MKKCSVCILPREERVKIDKLLLQEVSLKAISNEVGISSQVLNRHKPHITRQLVTSEKAKDMTSVEGIMSEMQDDMKDLAELVGIAHDDGKLMTAIAGIREKRGYLSLAAGLGLKLYEARQAEEAIKGTTINVGYTDYDLKRLDGEELQLFSSLLHKVRGESIPSRGRKKVDDREYRRLKESDAKHLRDDSARPRNIPSPVEVLDSDVDSYPDPEVEELDFEDEPETKEPERKTYPDCDLNWERECEKERRRMGLPSPKEYKRKRSGSADNGLGDAIRQGKVRVSTVFPRK